MTPDTILPVKDGSDDLELVIRASRNTGQGERVVVASDDIPGGRRANSQFPQASRVQSIDHDNYGCRPLPTGPQLVAADSTRSKFIEDETWRRA